MSLPVTLIWLRYKKGQNLSDVYNQVEVTLNDTSYASCKQKYFCHQVNWIQIHLFCNPHREYFFARISTFGLKKKFVYEIMFFVLLFWGIWNSIG